jgi:predicted RNA-binding protein with RPS1 domain
VHISELAERHVEIPEQVVQVNDDVMVKIIDIDLERRRISLSLKQANESVRARWMSAARPASRTTSTRTDVRISVMAVILRSLCSRHQWQERPSPSISCHMCGMLGRC